jgi:hypothetical protein
MYATAPYVSPAPPSQQKTQKNYRLTDRCIRMMQQLAQSRGITESALIEIVMREEYDRRGFKPESSSST